MHLAIRADGGPDIGYGHLARTGALAREFIERGHRVTYLTETPEHVEEVCPIEIEVQGIGEDDGRETIEWVEERQIDAVLTDSHEVDIGYQDQLREAVPLLAVVLDGTGVEVSCDMLINSNVYAPELDYKWHNDEPIKLLGPEYILLRRAFRHNAKMKCTVKKEPQRALIMMGGSDVKNETPKIIRAFDGFNIEVDVVIGPGFKNVEEIEETAEETKGKFNIFKNPVSLPDIMFQADIAVSACGTTLYELIASKTPTIGIPQVSNQEPVAKALSIRNSIINLNNGPSSKDLASVLDTLRDQKMRRRILKNSNKIIDGFGTERVFKEIIKSSNKS